jgi:hypothetical protein
MAQVAIAWALSKDEVSAPIVGTTNLKNLEDILGTLIGSPGHVQLAKLPTVCAGGVHIKLTEEEIKGLEEPYLPLPITGH